MSLRPVLLLSLTALVFACEPRNELPPLPERPTGLQVQVQQRIDQAYAAVDADAANPALLEELAMLLHVHDRFNAANQVYSRARTMAPNSFRLAYLHGDALEQAGDAPAALQAFEQALVFNPSDERAQMRVAQLLVRSGEVARGRAIYEGMLDNGVDRPELLYGLAQVMLRSSEPEAATVLLNSLVQKHGDSGPAHYALSQAWQQRGNEQQAAYHRALFDRYQDIRIPIRDPLLEEAQGRRAGDQPHLERASRLYKAGALAAAAEEYEKALAINPDNAAAHASLVAIYGTTGSLDKAAAHFRQAIADDANYAVAYTNYGTVLLQARQFADAEQVLRQAASLTQANAEILANLGYAIELQQRGKEAMQFYRQALQHDPMDVLANYLAGRALTTENNLDAAIEHLGRSAQTPSSHQLRALIALARAQRTAGDAERSVETLQRAVHVARREGEEATAVAIEDEIRVWSSD